MKYEIQKAVKTDLGTFNIGDEVLLIFDDGKVACKIQDFRWLDEYTSAIITDKGTYNLNHVKTILKYHLV